MLKVLLKTIYLIIYDNDIIIYIKDFVKMKATVVVSTYRNFNYIYKTIESVLMQNFDNLQLIITDDGSENFPKEEIIKCIEENNDKEIN